MEYAIAEIWKAMDEEYWETGLANPVDESVIPYFRLVEKYYEKNWCSNGEERGELEYRVNHIGYAFKIAYKGDWGRNWYCQDKEHRASFLIQVSQMFSIQVYISGKQIEDEERERTPAFQKSHFLRTYPSIHWLEDKTCNDGNGELAFRGVFRKIIEYRSKEIQYNINRYKPIIVGDKNVYDELPWEFYILIKYQKQRIGYWRIE